MTRPPTGTRTSSFWRRKSLRRLSAGRSGPENKMVRRSASITQADIADNEPIRLSVAAALAFPDGSMTASGLRREAARGRLTIERIAGKDFTTLQAINQMREQCRVTAKVQDSGCSRRAGTTTGESSSRLCGASEMAAASDA